MPHLGGPIGSSRPRVLADPFPSYDSYLGEGEVPVVLRVGDRVDNLTFVGPDSRLVPLAAFAGRPLLLIFLRHLA